MNVEVRKERIVPVVILFLVGVIAMLVNIGNTHLWDQDEGFYATTASEMHARRDWITPTFNGKLFAHKPPMMFWGMMLGYDIFGVSETGARFVSALFGMGTVFLTYAFAKKLFDATTALVSGLAIGSCITFTMISRSATADAHLTFFVTLALYVWCCDYFGNTAATRETSLASVRWRTWLATYAVMGLAVLTKGPIGFLFPTAILGLFLLTEKKYTPSDNSNWLSTWWLRIKPFAPVDFIKTVWVMRPLTAALVVLLVAAPWYAAVQWKTDGEFLREFIGVHHLGRMSQAMDNHSGPIYYYLFAILIGMYPWSAFAIPTAISWYGQFRQSAQSRSVRFVSCWVAVYLVIFSLASTKLPNYIVPAYPALAIIIGRYFALWIHDLNNVHRGWLHAGWILLIAVGMLVVTLVPVSGLVSWSGQTLLDRAGMDREFQQRFVWLGIAGLPLVLFGIAGYCFVRRNQSLLSAGSFALGALSLIVVLGQIVAPELDRFQASQLLAQRWSSKVHSAETQVAVLGMFRPTMVFYFGRDIDFCSTPEEAIRVANQSVSSILVTTDKQYAEIQDKLPADTEIIERVSQFPKKGEVFVLGDKSLKR